MSTAANYNYTAKVIENDQLRAANERLCGYLERDRATIEQLRAENAALAAALVVKDGALAIAAKEYEDMDEYAPDYLCDAHALQPHAALVAKLKAEAVREYVESLGAGNFTHQCVRCLKPYDPVGDSEDCPFCGCTDEEAKAIYDNAGRDDMEV